MPIYLVERYLPGITVRRLQQVRRAARETSDRLTAQGRGINYRGSIFLPGESRCLCLFEAASLELVAEANVSAELPYSRIVNAMGFQPDAPGWEPASSGAATDEPRMEDRGHD